MIDNIAKLESTKDPKCHATASRLEDFMYGTPLEESTRIRKAELQKKLILYIWNKASDKCRNEEIEVISIDVLESVVNDIIRFGKMKSGEWFVSSGDQNIFIKANDMRQYATVAYALRAMLSVEQDFLFNPEWQLVNMNNDAVDATKFFIDLITLATLQIADQEARKQNKFTLSPDMFQSAWNALLSDGSHGTYLNSNYPKADIIKPENSEYVTIRSIINQKIESYKAYNNISLPIFLRNIQVYFARHKWPSDTQSSDALKNYLVESLVYFCKELLSKADDLAAQESEQFLRPQHIVEVIPLYLPFEINEFEDVIYFPELEESIMIESYDLDAFRDSGIHWLILEYALNDLEKQGVREADPFAAELVVETVAQMALLVLRLTGEHSLASGNPTIVLDDMTMAFTQIQELINKNASIGDTPANENGSNDIITSSADEKLEDMVFFDRTKKLGIDFMHKSSDWLSRLIRGYVVQKDSNLIRMAIPPAFGGSGVAAEDLNNDGWQDIILTGGVGVKVYLNNGDETFRDITQSSGINTWNKELNSFEEIRQIIICDFDNDGWQDVFFSLVNAQHKIYRNNGSLRFEDMSDTAKLGGEALVAGPATSFDYNKDGLLDIYIGYFGNYLKGELPTLSRTNQNGTANMLLKNMGGFQFEAQEHNLEGDVDYGWTQALGHSDINQDGWQDVIVGNDFGVNAYYLNLGNGYFENASGQLKTDKPSYTMNVGTSDLNGDHFPDLYISNIVVMEKDEKYVNPSGDTKMNFQLEKMENIRTVEANDLFVSMVDEEGNVSYIKSDKVGRGYSATGWSWDADFFDFDNDGDEDLYCLNGMNDFRVYGSENPYYNAPDGQEKDVLYAHSNREKNNFFVNEEGILVDKASVIGGDLLANSRSASYLDYDRDGDLDIIVNNYHDKAVFLENKIKNNNNWIAIKLIGDPDNQITRDAIGANIILNSEDGNIGMWREVKSTTGYLSVHPKRQYFGLANNQKVDVTVKWPNGETKQYSGLDSNKEYTIDYIKGVL